MKFTRVKSHLQQKSSEIIKKYQFNSADFFFAGGCLASLLMGESPKDYDIYFTSEELALKIKKMFYKHPDVVLVTQNALTMQGGFQLITRFAGKPNDVIENFDFAHTKSYFYQDEILVSPEAIESILPRTLIYTGSEYPISSMLRAYKFQKRGWRLNSSELFKIAIDINKLNLNDLDVLREQLIGVDVSTWLRIVQRIEKGEIRNLQEVLRFLYPDYIRDVDDE